MFARSRHIAARGAQSAGLTIRPALLLWLCLAAGGWTPRAIAQQQRDEDSPKGKWEILRGCTLNTNRPVDGDSFEFLFETRSYICRLYFVDAPESDASFRDRIQDQAAYFGIAAEDIPRAGKLAAQFTERLLAGRQFTVITRWQNAMGRSSLARFYAVVLLEEKNLAEELVSAGLARIFGLRANWPDGSRSSRFISQLKNRELAAREQKLGVWNPEAFPQVAAPPPVLATNLAVLPEPQATPLVDLNAASAEELQRLPGLGPVLAGRVIAHRPYASVTELTNVPGIGSKTLERLRPLLLERFRK